MEIQPGRGFSAKPLAQLACKYLGLDQGSSEAAAETRVICPQQDLHVDPAFHLDGQFERAVAVADHTSFALEKKRVAGGISTHEPTIAYRIDNALFCGGRLFTYRFQNIQGPRRNRKLIAKVSGELDTAALPLSYFATLYFGHMVFDGGATALMARDFAETCFDGEVALNISDHVKRYWALFGLNYTPVRDVRIRHAWVFEDRGLNSHKIGRFRELGTRVRSIPGIRSGHGVFFRRRGWGTRRAPGNEAELEAFLAKRNYEIIDPGKMSVDDIVSATRGAEVLVGVEGSGMTHGMLAMDPGTTVVMLLPPWRFNIMMKDYADGLGQRFGFVVGQGRQDDYWIDPEEILRTIDLARR